MIAKMKPIAILPGLWFGLLITLTASAQTGNNNSINTNPKEELMTQTIINNKAIIRKLYEEALNKRDQSITAELVAPAYTGPGGAKGAAGFWVPLQPLIAAFPDMQWTVGEMVAEGDKVIVQFTTRGTHAAPFNGLAATGLKVTGTGIGFFELKEGKIVSAQVHNDRLGFLQELELLPRDINLIYARKCQ